MSNPTTLRRDMSDVLTPRDCHQSLARCYTFAPSLIPIRASIHSLFRHEDPLETNLCICAVCCLFSSTSRCCNGDPKVPNLSADFPWARKYQHECALACAVAHVSHNSLEWSTQYDLTSPLLIHMKIHFSRILCAFLAFFARQCSKMNVSRHHVHARLLTCIPKKHTISLHRNELYRPQLQI
jgi:hypothetical protein